MRSFCKFKILTFVCQKFFSSFNISLGKFHSYKTRYLNIVTFKILIKYAKFKDGWVNEFFMILASYVVKEIYKGESKAN